MPILYLCQCAVTLDSNTPAMNQFVLNGFIQKIAERIVAKNSNHQGRSPLFKRFRWPIGELRKIKQENCFKLCLTGQLISRTFGSGIRAPQKQREQKNQPGANSREVRRAKQRWTR